MRRANHGMRIVTQDRQQQQELESINEKRKEQLREKKKPLLLKQLQSKLKKLDEINEENFKEDQDPYFNDTILDQLQELARDAVKYELKEIEKLCKLAIGKRILNIELKKKKDQHSNKLKKRENIELLFRENRIQRYNYESLIEEKIKESTLIARAYDNGKGFIESISRYKDEYERALEESDFMGVIKQVNGIFYKNYSSIGKEPMTFTDILLSFVWIPIVVFVCFAITLPFLSFENQQIILMFLLGLILLVLFYVSARTFFDKPNNNNYIDQTIFQVDSFFQNINQKNIQKGNNIEWRCSKDFMYLQAIFHEGFPI